MYILLKELNISNSVRSSQIILLCGSGTTFSNPTHSSVERETGFSTAAPLTFTSLRTENVCGLFVLTFSLN